jgi:hypothetical protein
MIKPVFWGRDAVYSCRNSPIFGEMFCLQSVLNILMLTAKDDVEGFRNKEEHKADKLVAEFLMRDLDSIPGMYIWAL